MMRTSRIALFLAVGVALSLPACASSGSGDRSADQGEKVPEGNSKVTPVDQATVQKKAMASTPAKAANGAVRLSGTVLQKPWSKSVESWNAGGSEYYVLDVGGAEIEHRSATEGVTLKVTDTVSAEVLASMVGKRVEVSGSYVQARPYTPSEPTEQYPTGIDGAPLPRGAGFAVASIAEAP